MVDDIAQMLWRNQGAALTPELIAGLIQGAHFAMHQPVASSVPVHAPNPYADSGPRLLIDDPKRVATWVAEQVGQADEFRGYGAIGLLDASGELVAGFVLESVSGTNGWVHIAGTGKRWLTRSFLHACFDYAFNQVGLERITGAVAEDNPAAIRFDLHLGFEIEHVIRKGCPAGDVYMLVMWRDKCRWLRGSDGEIESTATA